MLTQQELIKIDEFGTIKIPARIRSFLNLDKSSIVILETQKEGALLKPLKKKEREITKKIAKMNLPVCEWEEMEKEIEKGFIG